MLQLTSGLRASEAIYALKEYLTKGNRSFSMLAEKSNLLGFGKLTLL